MDDIPNQGAQYKDIFGLIQARVPGLLVVTKNNEKFVQFTRSSGGTYATIFVDGVKYESAAVSTLNPDRILAVDVLKGLYASTIYGVDKDGGALLLTTKKLEDRSRAPSFPKRSTKGVLNILHPGYYEARSFYVPNYQTESIEFQKPDYRTSLYWNPNVEIKDESSTFEFYTGDRQASYLIWIEGVSKSGIPFAKGKVFEVRE